VFTVNDVPYTEDEIFHLPGFGYDGTSGLSPITIARQGIGLALSSEEYAARLFGSGYDSYPHRPLPTIYPG